jgi:NADPH:quinone reductase-like Zn-dependent oxidoreductase
MHEYYGYIMQAIVYDNYGSPDVLRLEMQERPTIGAQELLVEVHATSVTTADWRFRAALFPVGMRLLGRLMLGLLRPRNRATGREFSGRVVAVGADVTRFRIGDEVFGSNPGGVNAEYIAVAESGAVMPKPEGLTHAEAAALPFGAITSVHFLREMAKIRPGERVLIVGASGGVGVYAIQVAKHLGAVVTAICSPENIELVRSLGADHVIDYTTEDPTQLGRTWDVVVDPVGKASFRAYRALLSEDGRHVPIEGGLRDIWLSIITPWKRGPKVLFSVSTDNREALEKLCVLVSGGAIRPVIGHRFPMTEVVEAHRVVERRRRKGAVILDWPAARSLAQPIPLRGRGA